MNTKFSEYFRENFFQNEEELNIFLNSLSKNLTKTLRVNTNKISVSELKNRLEKQNYILKPTFQPNVFYVDRTADFDEYERRLGFTLEHLMGYFYIQELGASSSVFFLSEGKVDNGEYLILDMASSPGWKTTQLSEQYPNSFIVANEFDRNRTSQLICNIERMGSDNVWISNYNWQFLGRLTETFDKILLDAPCSGEGIWFKSIEALKYWNLKNVKKIADLQKKLFESWLNSLKIWWEMLYSTCTMNKLENEWVVSEILEKHPWSFEIIFEKRFWPHIDETWGFFVCRIRKLKSIDYRFSDKEELPNKWIERLSKSEQRMLHDFLSSSWADLSGHDIFKYSNEVIALKKTEAFKDISKRLYFFRLWKKIGKIENNYFEPNYYFWRDFDMPKIEKHIISDQSELDKYLRWMEVWHELAKWLKRLIFDDMVIWIWEVGENGTIKNIFPKIWMRK
ncbi:MAG: RNA methylase, NOL1/NOP2/sun family [uncultured bacterium (gcode 4)]|uniref:RNA methylase, NOL1/NOP2/sun family n=1 Tax=uncultured bacterium (gcode 4) TaxID=1234023 RepID=K2G0B9_9BACT|nr:MAG: RNA methylase, NOL1/NOP2/sun family [uncultured bacterium (gcode 4)]